MDVRIGTVRVIGRILPRSRRVGDAILLVWIFIATMLVIVWTVLFTTCSLPSWLWGLGLFNTRFLVAITKDWSWLCDRTAGSLR